MPIHLERCVVVQAARSDVWRDVLDVDVHPGFVDHVLAARILAGADGPRRTTAWTVDVAGVPTSWILAERIDHARHELRFRQLHGPFERFVGAWRIDSDERGGDTVLRLSVACEPGEPWVHRAIGRGGERLGHCLDGWLGAIRTWATPL